jgi:hypothetical protein
MRKVKIKQSAPGHGRGEAHLEGKQVTACWATTEKPPWSRPFLPWHCLPGLVWDVDCLSDDVQFASQAADLFVCRRHAVMAGEGILAFGRYPAPSST